MGEPFNGVIIADNQERQILLDYITHCFPSIELEHNEIHKGDHYNFSAYFADIDAGNVGEVLIKTGGNKHLHLVFECTAAKSGAFELIVNPTVTDEGTVLRCANNKLYSDNETDAEIFITPTVTGGTRDYITVIGSDGNNPVGSRGGEDKRVRERILDLNSYYVLRFTAVYDNTRASINGAYYEEEQA